MEFQQIFKTFKKHLWWMAIFVIIATTTAVLYNNQNYRPVYEASTKLIVNKTVEADQIGQEQMDLGAMASNIRLIETYKEIIKTPAIMDRVVERYPDLQVSSSYLIATVNVFALNQTQVMTIHTTDLSYPRAARIVNAVSEVFQEEIPNIMKVDNIRMLHTANVADNARPINDKSNQIIVIGFIVSVLLSVGIVLLLELLNDTIKTEQDVRDIFGAPTLALVAHMKHAPMIKQSNKLERQAGEAANAAPSR